MKRVFLIRHAKSSWAQRGLADHQRPLAERGLRDTRRVFARLLDYDPGIEHIVTSDAARARLTTQRLAQALGLGIVRVAEEPRLYLASPSAILEILHAQGDRHSIIAAVGHNPGFTDAANLLIDTLELDNLPTCGIVGMEFSIDRWSEVAAGGARLIYLDYPKLSGAPIIRA